MADPNIYLPGTPAPRMPLERYLPPVPAGVAAAWLEANVPKGAWVLDPFGASPYFAVEAARAGYRVAVAANNPVARFLLEMQAQPPSAERLRAVLAELSAARRGDERLEPAILELYMSECPKCKVQSPAEAFIWEREADAPRAKILDCKSCNERGEYPTDEADKERAAAYQRGGMHLSRALERIAPKGDPDREHAEEAIEAYLPRAVYALFTIINRIDGLALNEEQRRLISALVLSACDRANNLWAHPSGRMRPKQLVSPAQFREYNIWYEMERSIELWAQSQEAVRVLTWPEQPPENGGISLFEGRMREMASDLSQIQVQAVVSALPRPNQAFWTLCALWAGWIWGRDAIGPFALVLRRRRYDWAWHAEALHAGLSALSEQLKKDTPFFGVVTESESGFNAAAMVAANLADFRLEGTALRREESQAQITWRKGIKKNGAGEAAEIARGAAKATLTERAQPSHFLYLHAAALTELSKQAQMGSAQSEPGEVYGETKTNIDTGLTFGEKFLRFGSSEQSLETGLWWLEDKASDRSPLADRVEIAVVRYLLRRPGRTLDVIDRALCSVFPGLLTPAQSLVVAALESYGEESDGQWQLAAGDNPEARRKDLREMRDAVRALGIRLGFSVDGDMPIRWLEGEKPVLNFYVIASAVLGDVLLNAPSPAGRSLVVMPGRRAGLTLYKLERDPRFKQAMDDGWRFLKFRHIRRLAENHSLTPESFKELLDLDPLTVEQLQAPLL
jgi:hypothetical protein